MAKFVIFFIAALAFHAALAAPKKTQGGQQKNQVEEFVEKVQTAVDDVTVSLKKALPDEKQVAEDLTATSKKFAQDVEDIVKKLNTQISNNKDSTNTLLQQVSAKLTENINALKQAVGPEATAKVNEIKTQLETHLKDSATEIEKLGETIKPDLEHAGETISTFTKGIFDDFVAAAQKLKTDFDNTVEAKPRTIKHKN